MFKNFFQNKYIDFAPIIVLVILGALFYIISGSASFQIFTNFLSNNNFASPSSTLFTSANKNIFNLEYRYLVVVFLAVIVIKLGYKIYIKTNNKKNYKKYSELINLYVNSFSYAIFIIILSVLAGLQDISTIIMVGVSSFIGVRFLLNDSVNDENSVQKRWNGITLSVLSWILLIIYSVGTLIYGQVRSTWYVYVLDFLCLMYFVFIATSARKKLFRIISKRKSFSIFETVNFIFIVLSLLILAVGLK